MIPKQDLYRMNVQPKEYDVKWSLIMKTLWKTYENIRKNILYRVK